MTLPRIALLRGAYWGPFECQNFEPLLDRFDIHAYVLPHNPFDLTGCSVPISICEFPDSINGRSLINAWRSRVRGENYPMPGVPQIVRNAQIVHTFEGWYAYSQQAADECVKYHVPLVVTHWETVPYELPHQRHYLAVYEQASAIIAPSELSQRALLKMGIAAEKIVRLGMGVAAERFAPRHKDKAILGKLGLIESDFVFGFIGRLAPEKGLDGLLNAFQSVRNENRVTSRLILVGSGPERESLLETIRSLDLGALVQLVPAVPYREVDQWHRVIDAFVYPSRRTADAEEQFGYSLIEAMSCGKAVIANAVGGIPDVVGDAGILVPEENNEALADAMITVLRDADLTRKLGDRARQRVISSFSTEVVSSRLAEIYSKLL